MHYSVQGDHAHLIVEAASARDLAVASPRTWLLAVGWRRHVLVDPSEVPGATSR